MRNEKTGRKAASKAGAIQAALKGVPRNWRVQFVGPYWSELRRSKLTVGDLATVAGSDLTQARDKRPIKRKRRAKRRRVV